MSPPSPGWWEPDAILHEAPESAGPPRTSRGLSRRIATSHRLFEPVPDKQHR